MSPAPRGQIAACALFVSVISAATQARREGCFRIEWKLAAPRTHAMEEENEALLAPPSRTGGGDKPRGDSLPFLHGKDYYHE